jgi:hypothetical protein
VDPDFMVRTTLNNFTKPWGSFVRGIVAREVMPTWERLWDDFVQEETEMHLRVFRTTTDFRVMRTLLCGLRARRRPTEVLDRVPREGPNHNRVAVGKRET